ncbi:MAG: hypothetical protein ACE145_08285 [Terriglobia bacterium]
MSIDNQGGVAPFLERFLRWGFRLATVGLTASFVLHLLALGRVSFRSPLFAVVLHAGIFLLGVPLTFVLIRRLGIDWDRRRIAALYGVCPSWMRQGRYIVLVYFLLNAAIFSFRNPMGELVRSHRYEISPSILAFVTVGWMLGYYLLSEIFYALANSKPAFCTRGHVLKIGDVRCSKCGMPLRATGADLSRTSPGGRGTSS